jgi:hypothetical protein
MFEIYVALSSWIIQDGVYDDFTISNNYQFALEFHSENLVKSTNSDMIFKRKEESVYNINGKVLLFDENYLVIDVGIKLYWWHPNKIKLNLKPDDNILGDILIGVDPYFYFSSGCIYKNMPPLIYEWKIKQILMETAPFKPIINSYGGIMMVRDETLSNRIPITKIDAWNDDDGNADYLLLCELVNPEPQYEFNNRATRKIPLDIFHI